MTWNTPDTQKLFTAILALKTQNEAKRFFRDLLTEPELLEFSKRWKAAQMLEKNIPYSVIEKQTGLSSTTVARVAKWLNRGMGGYKLMLERLNHHPQSSLSRKV